MRKLQGRLDFQGLPISVENRKGSKREWYDPHNDEHGSTKMKFAYGYVKGTLGLDGDAVDVFVGPEETSTKVFVITQLSSPEFKKVDEQKVMLGFTSAKEAKDAYLDHYNDPRFFGSLKEMDLATFKEKLDTRRGKLIKAVLMEDLKSARMHDNSEGAYMTEVNKAAIQCPRCSGDDEDCENCGGDGSVSKSQYAVYLLKSVSAKLEEAKATKLEKDKAASEEEKPISKALTSAAVNGLAKRQRLEQAMAAYETHNIGTIRERGEHEPPVVPVRKLDTPIAANQVAPEMLKSCGSCGYIHKSLDGCPRCTQISGMNKAAAPLWRR